MNPDDDLTPQVLEDEEGYYAEDFERAVYLFRCLTPHLDAGWTLVCWDLCYVHLTGADCIRGLYEKDGRFQIVSGVDIEDRCEVRGAERSEAEAYWKWARVKRYCHVPHSGDFHALWAVEGFPGEGGAR